MSEINNPGGILGSEVTWAWFGTDQDTIENLDFEWVKLHPSQDDLPWGLEYANDCEIHYACRSRDIICSSDGSLSVVTLVLIYRESMLRVAGKGPTSCHDDFGYLEWTDLNLTELTPEDILVPIRALAADKRFYENFVRLCGCAKQPDVFVESIQDPELRDRLREIWAQGREEWETREEWD